MKKIKTLAVLLTMVTVMMCVTGCNSPEAQELQAEFNDWKNDVADVVGIEKESESESVVMEDSVDISEEVVDHSEFFNASVPDPSVIFAGRDVNVWSAKTNRMYGFTLTNATADDFAAYINAVDSEVFVYEFSRNSTYLHAASSLDYTTSDYFSLEVTYFEDMGELTVTCGFVDKTE